MKRKVFKEWIEMTLWGIIVITFLIASAECENNLLFFGKAIISIVVILLNLQLLYKYGRILKK